MKQFFKNMKRYREYALYSAISSLRAQVSGSYFNWLWWILDPLLFMLVYSFVALIAFGKSEPHFIPFVFVGLAAYNYFSRCVNASVKLVRTNKSVISRIYLPKYILVFTEMAEHMVELLITLALCVIASFIDHVTFSWYILWTPLILVVLMIVTFGFSTVLLHAGVYAKDLSNIVNVTMRLVFYLSGVFYSLQNRIPAPFNHILIRANPVALVMNELRRVMVYASAPDLKALGVWAVIGVLISAFGIHLIQKYEQNYVKAI